MLRILGQQQPEPTTEARDAHVEARQLRQQASDTLRYEIERSAEVDEATASLRRAHLRNHLSESMERLIVRGHPQ